MPDSKKSVAPSQFDSGHKIIWDVSGHIKLPKDFYCPPADLFNLLESRESRRSFKALSIQDISNLLWFSLRQTRYYPNDSDHIKTPVLTAGSLASVRVIILRPSEKAWVYDRKNHIGEVLPASVEVCNKIRNFVNDFFDIGDGTLLLFFSSRSFIETYYKSPDSLVLREAGGILGTLALLSEAFEFAFCPLGTTGGEWSKLLLNVSEEAIVSAGAAVVGRR